MYIYIYIFLWQSLYGFSSFHVQMWELDHKEGWVQKNWCPLTAVLEKALERSPLDCKEFKPVNPKGNQPWILIGKMEVEAPTLWPPKANSWLLEKTLMLGKIEGRRRRGQQRMSWLDGITNSMVMNLSKLLEIVEDRGAWRAIIHGVTKGQTQVSHWITTTTVRTHVHVSHLPK